MTALRGILIFALAGSLFVGGAEASIADNCSSLSDCFFTLSTALLVAALLAFLLAFLISGGGTGLFAFAGVGATGASSAAYTAMANAAVAAAAAAAAAHAAGRISSMSHGGTPGNNSAQNREYRHALKEVERRIGRKLDEWERRLAHNIVSGQNYGYHGMIDAIIGELGL